MELYLRNYIVDKLCAIIKDLDDEKIDDINLDFNITIQNYKEFFSSQRIEDIVKYKEKGCISKEIYNFLYLVLTKTCEYDKDYIIQLLKPKVDEQINLYLEINVKIKKTCNNCISRNNCFNSFNNKICKDYKPGPTNRPKYWPGKNLGGMHWL